MSDDELLSVDDLRVTYELAGGRQLTAVAGISFIIRKGVTLGLVG